MSAPYGAPQQQPASPPGKAAEGPDLKFILTLVAAGVGVVGYIIGFLDANTAGVLSQLAGFSFVTAAGLAGLRLLPKAPNTLYAAIPLALYGALGTLQLIVSGAGGVVVVLLLLAIVQLGALAAVLLLETGVIQPPAPRQTYPQSGGFQQPQPPTGPYAQQPQPQQPQPGWNQAPPAQQQPGGWNPPSGGAPTQPPAGGPQGTQQMPHPNQGNQPPTF